MLLAFVLTFSFMATSAMAANPVLDERLPTGDVEPIEIFGEEVDDNDEAEKPLVTAKPYDARIRSYITPTVSGYTNYGYEWLRTDTDPYIVANRAALLGLYEAFTKYSEIAYYSTANFSTLARIDVSALNIPANSQGALDAIAKLLRTVAFCFESDNPQYYFVANSYSYNYYSGTGGYLYTVRPYTRASYETYAFRQTCVAAINSKYAEYLALANGTSVATS